ncbi:hypothetical protein SAMN05216404_1164 [Nitrosospira multiformis]|uniref:Uncharacterized protein n=1 Tax=Nitrosospira multiformis TaxID=1231 RepID=A0A1H8NDV1_9PROT|nr:hypothetical protein [Nitrosospira multiformis]SEO27603.1 hypothetical protein SAMN05216404_1164 [Nitrosospira multiformis]
MSRSFHILALFDPAFLWHMTHSDDPFDPWDSSKLKRVNTIPGKAFNNIACAVNQNDDLQVCSVTQDGGLFHAIRGGGDGT